MQFNCDVTIQLILEPLSAP